MSWTRKELIEQSRQGLKEAYWKTTLASFLLTMLSDGVMIWTVLNIIENIPQLINDIIHDRFFSNIGEDRNMLLVLLIFATASLLFLAIMKIIIAIFFRNPVEVGTVHMYGEVLKAGNEAKMTDILFVFDSEYLNVVKVLLIRSLKIAVFSILFIIPGIIKYYQYRMVPYLLAEDPSLKYDVALDNSKKMMNGNKLRAFLLDCSFILWHILGIITIGFIEVFYVLPKKAIVDAALYQKLKNREEE